MVSLVGENTTSTDYETRGYYSAYLNDLFWRNYAGNNYTTYTEQDYDELWIRRNDKVEHPTDLGQLLIREMAGILIHITLILIGMVI